MAGYTGWQEKKKINWDKVSTDAPAPVAPGICKGEIIEAEPRKSSAGKPSARLIIEFTERYDSDDTFKRKVFVNTTFTEDAGFMVKGLCEALAQDPPETNGFDDVKEWCEALVGESVWAQLNIRTYEGKKNNNVVAFIHEDDLKEAAAALEETGDSGEEEDKPRGRAKPNGKANGKAKPNGAKTKGRKSDAEDMTDDEGEDAADDAEEEEETPRRRRR